MESSDVEAPRYKPQPFSHNFKKWQTDQPVEIQWKLKNPVEIQWKLKKVKKREKKVKQKKIKSVVWKTNPEANETKPEMMYDSYFDAQMDSLRWIYLTADTNLL